MTGQELIDAIQDNFGDDRDTIGSRSFSEAALDAVNYTIKRVTAKNTFSSTQRLFTGTLQTGSSRIALPTTDHDGNTIDVKWIEGIYVSEVGGTTGWTVEQLSSTRKDKVYPASTNTGRPFCYSRFREWIELHPIADSDYTLYIRVTIRPQDITLAQENPLGTNLDRVIVAGATSYLYAALQEPQDAQSWEALYRQWLDEELVADRYCPDWLPLPLQISRGIGDVPYYSDPFSRKRF